MAFLKMKLLALGLCLIGASAMAAEPAPENQTIKMSEAPLQPTYRTYFIQCYSWGFSYNECFTGPGLLQATLIENRTGYACYPNMNWGVRWDRVWVSQGCGGLFSVLLN